MNHRLSERVCEAVAKDFLEEAVTLSDTRADGVHYQFDGARASVRTDRGDDGVGLLTGAFTADIIGGITFALAEQGEIPAETAIPENVARICFALGQLTAVPK
jgi:hypothetical protein